MNFKSETQQKIEQFAKEQSQYYLDAAEMTYIEKLRMKTDRAKKKIEKRLARFRNRSKQGQGVKDDLILYMSDYINDLITQGMGEDEAFERARNELKHASNSEQAAGLNERYAEYFQNRDPEKDEAIGLFYAAFCSLGLFAGAITGFIIGGGREGFLSNGWIDTIVGTGIGIFIALPFGMFSHAIIALCKKSK